MSDTEASLTEFDAFGLPMRKREELDFLQELEEEPEAPIEEPEVPAESEEEAPAEAPAEEEAPVEEEVSEEAPEQPSVEEAEEQLEELIFGKYKTLEDAEKGYHNLLNLQQRTAEQRREIERAFEDAVQRGKASEDREKQFEEAIKQAGPYIQKQQAQIQWLARQLDEAGIQVPQQAYQAAQQPVQQPQQRPEDVQKFVQSEVETMRQQIRAEEEARQFLENAEQAVMEFYDKHNIVQNDDTDAAMAQAVLELEDSWERMGVEEPRVAIDDPEMLDIVWEAYQDPSLMTVLKKNPHLTDDDEGMQLARFEAALLKGQTPITQQKRQVPASQVGQGKPQAERASGGGAQQPSRPLDEWEQIKQVSRRTRQGRAGSPFFE